MKCTICGRPIVLVPSATERAKKFGKTPAFYTRLFTTHSSCQIEKNRQELKMFLKSLTRHQDSNRVTL